MLGIINRSENKIFYATRDAAGFDISSTEEGLLSPGEFRVFKTGLFVDRFSLKGNEIAVPELQIRPRSGLAAKYGVTVLNAPGTVDCQYPDEIGVILINHGKLPFYVEKGMRIAQGVVVLVARAEGVEVKPAERSGGLGSTGVKS